MDKVLNDIKRNKRNSKIIRTNYKHWDILDGRTKKGKPFIPAKDRAYIVDSIKDVDYVVIYDHSTKYDCCEALEIIKPNVFTKGGDRDSSKKVPEAVIVEKYGGTVQYNVGDAKVWSSSDFLKEWVDFSKSQD